MNKIKIIVLGKEHIEFDFQSFFLMVEYKEIIATLTNLGECLPFKICIKEGDKDWVVCMEGGHLIQRPNLPNKLDSNERIKIIQETINLIKGN